MTDWVSGKQYSPNQKKYDVHSTTLETGMAPSGVTTGAVYKTRIAETVPPLHTETDLGECVITTSNGKRRVASSANQAAAYATRMLYTNHAARTVVITQRVWLNDGRGQQHLTYERDVRTKNGLRLISKAWVASPRLISWRSVPRVARRCWHFIKGVQ